MAGNGALFPESELPDIPVSWKWARLGQLVDQDRGICYGIVQPGNHDPNGVPMVNSQDVLDGNVASRIEFRVSADLHQRFKRSMIRGGEVLLTLVGANFGRVAIASKRLAGFNCSRAVGILPVKENPEFVMFCLRSPLLRRIMDNWANTTVQPTFNLKEVANLPIPQPPHPEQKAIALILGTLDDKIEMNRRMNETLESMARAIFKSWFVDFDPVQAKMEGRQPIGMDAETSELFVDSFEDSLLGPKPTEWRIQRLVQVTTKIGSGATPRGGADVYLKEGIALIRSQNVHDHDFRWDGLAFISDQAADELHGVTVEKSDILFNITGDSILRTCVVDPSVLPARVNQHVSIIRPAAEIPPRFLHLCLVRPQMKEFLLGFDTGGTRKAVTKGHLESVPVLVPPPSVLSRFKRITDPFYARVQANLLESRVLADLRDTLLPKLLSGELSVPSAIQE